MQIPISLNANNLELFLEVQWQDPRVLQCQMLADVVRKLKKTETFLINSKYIVQNEMDIGIYIHGASNERIWVVII